MRNLGMTLSVAALALLGACSRGNDARSDDALKNDLALAAQAQQQRVLRDVLSGAGPGAHSPHEA